MRILKNSCIAFVELYRLIGAPLFVSLGVRCRFSPSCSEYAAGAIEAHGVGKGILLTGARLLRCHPFCRGGHDPVPVRKILEMRNG